MNKVERRSIAELKQERLDLIEDYFYYKESGFGDESILNLIEDEIKYIESIIDANKEA